MANITYSNKSSLNTDSSIDEKYKVTSGNMNEIKYVVNGKQDTLISGTNIKTINNDSILGSGNITVSAEDEVAIQTTQPTDSEIVWIDPNESVNVYGSYISNTYGTSQTIGYSQEYVNGKTGEVLWTNNDIGASFGNVILNINTSEYNIIEVFYHRYQSDKRNFSTRILNEGDKKSQLFYSDYDSGVRSWNRNIDWNDTAFEFAHNTINGSIDDNGLIPIQVIGYK